MTKQKFSIEIESRIDQSVECGLPELLDSMADALANQFINEARQDLKDKQSNDRIQSDHSFNTEFRDNEIESYLSFADID